MRNKRARQKQAYGMADGGRPNPGILGSGGAFKAAVALAGRGRQIDDAIESATAPPKQANKPATLRRGMADGGPPKRQQDGGPIRGPGGPTDDQAGTYRLSNKEYVLPADTTEAIGEQNLDVIRAATHDFVDDSNRPNGLVNGGPVDDERKRRVIAGGSEINAGALRPPTKNYADLVRQQKPLLRSIGEGLGEGVRVAGDAAIQTGRNIGTLARSLNRLPGQVAAPIATGIDSFGAAIRSGFTGEQYSGRQYEAKPVFGGGDAQAAPVPSIASPARSVQPRSVAQQPAGQSVAPRIAQPVTQTDNQLPEQDGVTPRSYSIAEGLSKGGNRDYQRLGGGAYDGNAAIYAKSNRADGKLNDFAGSSIPGRLPYEQRPENIQNFNEATARAAKDSATLKALAVSNAGNGTADGIDRAYRLAAGNPEVTAAVDAARNTGDLQKRALGGSSKAANLLQSQADNATRLSIADIGAKTDEARLGIARDAASLQKRQFESADAVNQLGVREKQAKLKDQEQITVLRDQIANSSPDDPGYAKAVSRYNLLTGNDGKEKFSPLMGKDELGNPVYLGAFNNRTGEMNNGAGARPAPSAADITATAKKYGISEAEVKQKLGL